jgi:hypothetical protein
MDISDALTEGEWNNLEELDNDYWLMSGHGMSDAKDYNGLIEKVYEEVSIEELFSESEVSIEFIKVDRQGLHVTHGYHGRAVWENPRFDIYMEFESGEESGEEIVFETRTDVYRHELEGDVNTSIDFVDYVDNNVVNGEVLH